MKKTTVYIDESGTLPDPQDKVIVITAVATDFPQQLDMILQSVRKRARYNEGDGMKGTVLK